MSARSPRSCSSLATALARRCVGDRVRPATARSCRSGSVALGAAVLGLRPRARAPAPAARVAAPPVHVGVAVAVGQLVVLAALSRELMFVSAPRRVAVDGRRGVRGRRRGARGAAARGDAMRDVEALRDALAAVGEGSRAPAGVNGRRRARGARARGEHAMVKLDRRGARAPRPDRGRLARPAHADHLAAAAGRGGRRRHRRRADARAAISRRCRRTSSALVGADRRPVRAVAARGGGHPVDDPAGVARPARRGDGRRAAAPGRGQGRQRRAPTCARAAPRAPTPRRSSACCST